MRDLVEVFEFHKLENAKAQQQTIRFELGV